MKYELLTGKSVAELHAMLGELKKETFNLRMQQALGESVKTHRFNECRKDVARIKTRLRVLQLEAKEK